MTALIKGTRVRHVNKANWGVGQLLEDSNSEFIRVFFEGASHDVTEIQAAFADKLTVVTGKDAESALLDNMHLPGPGKSRPKLTMSQAKTRLLEIFPGGLHGDKMIQNERNYKDAMTALARKLYAPETLQSHLDNNRYDEILDLAYLLVKSQLNNFPASFEKIEFGNGVKALTRTSEFGKAFCDWVMPEHPTQRAFEAFASELDHMGCAKWPILTAYRFLLHPDVDVLIKPTNLANAAEVARFEINYRPQLNWLTYHSVMHFYHYVRQQISDLKPRDMIDVQNFIWCIDPEQYPQ